GTEKKKRHGNDWHIDKKNPEDPLKPRQFFIVFANTNTIAACRRPFASLHFLPPIRNKCEKANKHVFGFMMDFGDIPTPNRLGL
ncbi:hypothetical protein, partial [Thiolapillus sp.]|uniref:hypothetical protein n=1 Tax=Thiolapillus sp. TaxID=2017437 RepID=UPI003AF4C49F